VERSSVREGGNGEDRIREGEAEREQDTLGKERKREKVTKG